MGWLCFVLALLLATVSALADETPHGNALETPEVSTLQHGQTVTVGGEEYSVVSTERIIAIGDKEVKNAPISSATLQSKGGKTLRLNEDYKVLRAEGFTPLFAALDEPPSEVAKAPAPVSPMPTPPSTLVAPVSAKELAELAKFGVKPEELAGFTVHRGKRYDGGWRFGDGQPTPGAFTLHSDADGAVAETGLRMLLNRPNRTVELWVNPATKKSFLRAVDPP